MSGFSYEDFQRVLKQERAQRMTARPVLRLQVLHYAGEQIRRHRKRRINKKWRKRYGTEATPEGRRQVGLQGRTAGVV